MQIGFGTSRVEDKFFIPDKTVDRFRDEVLRYVERDSFSKRANGGYMVNSVYFDTRELTAYHDKLAGVRNRRKLRVRGYDASEVDAPVFLEIKRKSDMRITKSRAKIARTDLDNLLQTGDVNGILTGKPDDQKAARSFLYYLRRDCMYPMVLIKYEREAFFASAGSPFRMTIDRHVRAAVSRDSGDPFQSANTAEVFPGRSVIEAKYPARMPGWFATIIDRYELEREAISKYVLGAEAAGLVKTEPSAARSIHQTLSTGRGNT
jgi:SPX domain protein involved in polyphosphate accumulation